MTSTSRPHPALPDGYVAVDLPESRQPEVVDLDAWAFAAEPPPEHATLITQQLEWHRTRGVEAPDGSLAAMRSSYTFALPVPGGVVPTAGLTWVGVHPGHRRRGLLSAMIREHLERSVHRGEVVSALFAAEPGIYGRFGYGTAAQGLRMTVPRGAALRDVPGSANLTVRLERLDPEQHGARIAELHAEVGRHRPGWITRGTDGLRAQHLTDLPAWRKGAEALRVLTVMDGRRPRGYALFRRKEDWGDGSPRGAVLVRELVACDAAAAHRMWSVLLDLDLMATVETPMLAVDDPLLNLLVDSRACKPRLHDNLWLRILDLPQALAGRRYAGAVDVVLDVTDAALPANAGRWRLSAPDAPRGGAPAQVTRVEDDSVATDLSLDVRELAAAYLGGTTLGALAAAGLVTERTPGALVRTSTAFSWPVAPVCSWVF